MNRSVCLFAIALLFTGCTQGQHRYRADPLFDQKKLLIKTVAIADPMVEIFEVSAGGVREKVDEWSQTAAKNLKSATETELAGKSSLRLQSFTAASLSIDAKTNLADTYALFDAVSAGILLHTYGQPEFRFNEKLQNFDYSLGAEVRELAGDAEVLLFMYGVNHVSTGGRKAVQAGTMVVGALLGVGIVPDSGPNLVVAAVVDAKTGAILWYNMLIWGNLTDEANARNAVKELFGELSIR